MEILRASAAIPFVSQMVEINGNKYLDYLTLRKEIMPRIRKAESREIAEGEKVKAQLEKNGFEVTYLDVDKNAIQRIECGKRFVTDIELKAFAEIFNISIDSLV